jgi:hypothetical protein
MKNALRCKQPDHDVPGIGCGYPLPCPWHTVIVETRPTRVLSPRYISRRTRRALASIGDAFDDQWK